MDHQDKKSSLCEKLLPKQDRELLEKLGYWVCVENSFQYKRIRVFNDIISEVEECMNHYSCEEVVELVKNKQSFIYVEMKMYYELGLNRIPGELDIAHNQTRNLEKCDMETYVDVFGNNFNPTIDEAIISIATYKHNQKKQIVSKNKNVYMKKISKEATIVSA